MSAQFNEVENTGVYIPVSRLVGVKENRQECLGNFSQIQPNWRKHSRHIVPQGLPRPSPDLYFLICKDKGQTEPPQSSSHSSALPWDLSLKRSQVTETRRGQGSLPWWATKPTRLTADKLRGGWLCSMWSAMLPSSSPRKRAGHPLSPRRGRGASNTLGAMRKVGATRDWASCPLCAR